MRNTIHISIADLPADESAQEDLFNKIQEAIQSLVEDCDVSAYILDSQGQPVY